MTDICEEFQLRVKKSVVHSIAKPITKLHSFFTVTDRFRTASVV
jgi:hypothetical protein